jgi:hypothetical protein
MWPNEGITRFRDENGRSSGAESSQRVQWVVVNALSEVDTVPPALSSVSLASDQHLLRQAFTHLHCPALSPKSRAGDGSTQGLVHQPAILFSELLLLISESIRNVCYHAGRFRVISEVPQIQRADGQEEMIRDGFRRRERWR